MKRNNKKLIFLVLIILALMSFLFSCKKRRIDVTKLTSVEEFNNEKLKIGVVIGTSISVEAEKVFDKAKIEYFSTGADLMSALKLSKVDAVIFEEYNLTYLSNFKNLNILHDFVVGHTTYALGFPKSEVGKALRDDFNLFLNNLRVRGKLQDIVDYWIRVDLPRDANVDLSELKNENGELTMYTQGFERPFSFVFYNNIVGIDLALTRDYCKEKGYALNIEKTSLVLPALTSGKCDFAGSGIEVTEERKDAIYFSDPVYIANDVIVINDASAIGNYSLIDEIKDGFHETLIEEDRYILFLQGVFITIAITIFSLVLGTAIGFILYVLFYSGCEVIEKVFDSLNWLFKRLPMVVFLMILLYVIFAHVDVSGVVVAIIGFTITFSTSVFSMINTEIKSIDKGQVEAATALGYTKVQTFYDLLLPQAFDKILPVYQGAILQLITSTSIVGYVMVSDLTKAGDLVRSRTFGEFFPLLFVAIIYIIFAKVLTLIISYMSKILLTKFVINYKSLKGKTIND